MVNAHTICQAGHPESWLCSIFANLTDDLAAALRDAWLTSMILRRQATGLAEGSTYNRMCHVLSSSAIHEAEVTTLPPVCRFLSTLGGAALLQM